MMTTAATHPGASGLMALLSGKARMPGPPQHALINSGRMPAAPPPPGTAGGADPAALFTAMLSSRDGDGDGQVSRAEVAQGKFSAQISKAFAAIDADGDGMLASAEQTAAGAAVAAGTDLRSLAKAGGTIEVLAPPPEPVPAPGTAEAAPLPDLAPGPVQETVPEPEPDSVPESVPDTAPELAPELAPDLAPVPAAEAAPEPVLPLSLAESVVLALLMADPDAPPVA